MVRRSSWVGKWFLVSMALVGMLVAELFFVPLSADAAGKTRHVATEQGGAPLVAAYGHMLLSGDFSYDGQRATVDKVVCNPVSVLATRLEQTWCGTVTSGGSYAEIGVNYIVRDEVPTPWGGIHVVTYNQYLRTRVDKNGNVTFHGNTAWWWIRARW